jgi:predicted RecA/RadA family phage recombinase
MNDLPSSTSDTQLEANRPAVVTTKQQIRKPSRLKRALIVSVLAHGVFLLVLVLWYLPKRSADQARTAAAAASKLEMQKDSRPAPQPPPELVAPKAADDVPAEQIKKSVDSQLEASKKLPPEVKLSELEKNLSRLKSIASEKSVQQVTEKIGSSLGLDTQAYQPKDSVPEGRFDLDTAQLSDVTRQAGKNGQWKYEATLVDASGRTSKVQMAAAEGATMYEVFAKMKKYPMAAGIYRSVVMPMLQKMIEAEKVAKKAAREARRIDAAEQSK